jgi:parvulin-like peptidyl-prolyl isomerase
MIITKRIIWVPIALLITALLTIPSYAEDAVVARVNNAVITASELEAAIDRLIPRATYHGTVSEEKRSEFREKALNDLIDQELQYQAASAEGMKPDKKIVKAQMEQIRDRFKSKKEYKAALEQAKLTEGQLEAQVTRVVLIQNALDKHVTGPAKMHDEELKDYYEKNTAKFKQPESVKLRIISNKNEKKAAEALVKIKAGADFGSVAEEYSEDQYRVMGGDLGYQHKGKLLPEIESEAFSLKLGGLSELIKAADLWFIIKVEDKKPEQQMSFNESKDRMRKDLETKRTKELYDTMMAALRAKAKIEVLKMDGNSLAKKEDGRLMTNQTSSQKTK